jgi:hypothetical protein
MQIKARFPDCPIDATGHIAGGPGTASLLSPPTAQRGAVLPKGTNYISLMLSDGPRIPLHTWPDTAPVSETTRKAGRASERNHQHLPDVI